MDIEAKLKADYANVRRRLWARRRGHSIPEPVYVPKASKPPVVIPMIDFLKLVDQNAHVVKYRAFKFYCQFNDSSIDDEYLLVDFNNMPVQIERIIREVSLYFGVSVLDIKSSRRTKEVILPRQIAMYLSKKMTIRSFPSIGRLFGNKDHTTVLFGVRKIEALKETNPVVSKAISEISASLRETI